ncbi:MAG TPA: nitrogen fixation negative regulator NifL [Rhodocyclaceae bacterium]|nr:nitrogen fixation negative regulator NifL [Rhodocyclaceae bacterium]
MAQAKKTLAVPHRRASPPAAAGAELPAEVYRQAVEQADVAISITDDKANIQYANAAFARVTGYDRADVLGSNESALSAKTTPRGIYHDMWKTLDAGRPWAGRLLNRRRDGREYLAELTITPVLDAAGQVAHYLGMHRDITAMHQLEQRVRNQKQLIEAVVDAAPMAIALLDAQRRVILDNQAYKKLVTDLGTAEPAEVLLAGLGAAGEAPAGRRETGEVRIDRPGGRGPRWFACAALPIAVCDESADAFFAGESGRHTLLVATDITALRVEQERARTAALKSLLSEEEHAAKLREGLSAAIYRLEEPLNVIASAVGRLRARGDSGVSTALAQALEMGRLHMEDLRRIIPTRAPEAALGVNLNEVLRDVLDITTPQLLAAGITVEWQPAPVLRSVIGRPLALRTLFKALLDNAIEAVGAGGRRRNARREIRVETRTGRDGVEVLLDDSGPGIPPDQRLKVFEPFYTTGTAGKHLGTGLSRAQQIVAEHGGDIEIADAPRGGCRLVVSLPVTGAVE